ncbi:MAG: CHASE3 domain-containing protein [Candidatus Brocadia sp.]|jgi:methyl-accepting chemotaxis protein
MKLTVGKKIGGSFVILILVSAISGGLILYWLTNLTKTNQTVLTVRTPSMMEAERLMRNYGLAIGGTRGFIASGDEKYLQDFEKAKSGIQESYKRLEELSKQWVLQENKDLLKEIGVCLSKFYASANQVFEKRRSPENDVAAHYFTTNMVPLFTSINEKIDKVMEELSKSPGTNVVRDAIYASAQYRAGTARLGMAIRGFMENADGKYVKDYEAAQIMRAEGLKRLQSLSKDMPAGLQEIVKGINKDEEIFITHPEKIFAIRRGDDYRLDLKHLREELAPLVAVVQRHVDQIGMNMSKLLDGETQTTLRLQKSMWLIALIAVGASVAAGALLAVFNIKLATKITSLFKKLLSELTDGAAQVASASEQISASSQSLSQSTSEQAASIEETSSTMEEISSMTKQNADNASEASRLAKACSTSVEHGNNTVIETDAAMKAITESSAKIADIIKIIEGIAFQTNLLALNAAVEAARAGDHGRGFAVVAEEVRNLAQRSSAAAKDITALITDSVKKSEAGMGLVKKTRDVFSDVVTQVKKVTDLVNEIATASEEQTNGIDQISKAIQQMDQVVQQNAANAEETAAASEELSSQAQALNALVDKIAVEVNMDSNEDGTVVRSTVVKDKEVRHEKGKGTFAPSYKETRSVHRGRAWAVRKKTMGGDSDALEDISSAENGKGLVPAGAGPDRLIAMSEDEFKDF